MNETLVDFTLSPGDVLQIELICDRFEQAWKSGERPELESHLHEARPGLRPALLQQLLPLDCEYRLRAGDELLTADYAERFSQLRNLDDLIDSARREVAVLAARDVPSEWMGEYRILRQVGRGGMGIVYEALDERRARRVALKVLASVHLPDSIARERFRREAESTARLNHPSLVEIFEVGEHRGQPFLALEFVAGQSLADRLRQSPLSAEQAAELIERLALAVQYAHDQGIVHRDLKPANVLLSAAGPKITDFGLAYPLGEGDLTVTGEIVGTPGYMAPEQALGKCSQQSVGKSADVYALGAMLYATLTGRPPFQGATALDSLEQVRWQEPVPPSRHRANVPRELETICLKCLEKEPARRYASADALAEDLRRFLAGDPIAARRAGHVERRWRWCRRNPVKALASVLGLVAIVSATGLAISQSVTRQLRREQRATHEALQAAKFQKARAENNAKQLAQQQQLTQSALVEAERFRRQAEQLSAGFARERGLALLEQDDVARAMLMLAHALQIAPADDADLQRVIRHNLAAAYQRLPYQLHSVLEHEGDARQVGFGPESSFVLAGGLNGDLWRWTLGEGSPTGGRLAIAENPMSVAISGNGAFVAAARENSVTLWDAATEASRSPFEHSQAVQFVTLSPDGKLLFSKSADGACRVWETATGALRTALHKTNIVQGACFSPDNRTLVLKISIKRAQFWDVASGQPLGASMFHPGEISAMAFRPDSRVLAIGREEGTLQQWEARTGKSIGLPLLHRGPVRAVGYTADGASLWTGAYGQVRLWDASTLAPRGLLVNHQSTIHAAAFSDDQSRIVIGSADGNVRLWTKTPQPSPSRVLPHKHLTFCVAISPSGEQVVTGSAEQHAIVWDAKSGKATGLQLKHPSSVLRAAFSPDGSLVATAGSDDTARLWNAAGGEQVGPALAHDNDVYSVHFSPDGKLLLTGSRDGFVRLWSVETGKIVGEPMKHSGWVHAATFSPDGRSILTGCEDGLARLWDVDSCRPIGEPIVHRGPVRATAFSPDGRKLLTATWDDRTARLWDAATHSPLGPPLVHREHVLTAAFSPDGKTIATGSWDGAAHLWDVATGKLLGPPLTHPHTIRDLAFSPDGTTLWTAAFDRTARSWELANAVPGDARRIVSWVQVLTGLELDSDSLFRELDASTWRERRQLLGNSGGPPMNSPSIPTALHIKTQAAETEPGS